MCSSITSLVASAAGPTKALYLDEPHVGQRFTSDTRLIDEEQIKAFAKQFDLNRFILMPGLQRETEADISGIDDVTFQKHAQDAKQNCPVSKALAGTEIHLNAKLL